MLKKNLPVVAPPISIIHFESLPISRELKGRTRTATFTEDMLTAGGPGGLYLNIYNICNQREKML